MQGFKRALPTIAGLLTLSFASSAMAVMSAPYGWYAEVNGGSSSMTNKSYPASVSSSSSGVGGSGNLGYKFMPYFAVEGDYSQYPNTSLRNGSGTEVAEDQHYSFALDAKGIFPVSDTGVELFAKLGASQLRSSIRILNDTAASAAGIQRTSHSNINAYWGGGVAYYFMPELAVNGQWMRAQGSSGTGTLSLLSLGITFIFG